MRRAFKKISPKSLLQADQTESAGVFIIVSLFFFVPEPSAGMPLRGIPKSTETPALPNERSKGGPLERDRKISNE